MRRIRSVIALIVVSIPISMFGGTAQAACSSTTTRSISGTILGADRRYVNVLIGFDVLDSANRVIGMDGCVRSGYSRTLAVNPKLPATGQISPAAVSTWRLSGLPANAVGVTIEVYPKNPSGYTDQTRYGSSMRRTIKPGATGANLRIPVICSQGGATGGIRGSVYKGGVKVAPSRTRAWSGAADSNTVILGWNMGKNATGWYEIPNLVSGQYYWVWISYNGVTIKRQSVYVSACHWTPLSFSF